MSLKVPTHVEPYILTVRTKPAFGGQEAKNSVKKTAHTVVPASRWGLIKLRVPF